MYKTDCCNTVKQATIGEQSKLTPKNMVLTEEKILQIQSLDKVKQARRCNDQRLPIYNTDGVTGAHCTSQL